MSSPFFSQEVARAAIATSHDSTIVRATGHTAERLKPNGCAPLHTDRNLDTERSAT